MTALAEKLEAAGMSRIDNDLRLALALYRNNGGTHEQARALLDAAFERDEPGQVPNADKAKIRVPGSSRPTPVHGVGRRPTAAEASHLSPRPMNTGALRAARAAKTVAARSALDSYRVRDGRAIGDVEMAEVEAQRFESAREAALFRLIQKHVANPPLGARVRDCIRPADLQRFIQKAAEVAEL